MNSGKHCQYMGQPRVCLLKLAQHRRGIHGYPECAKCDYGLTVWAKASNTSESNNEKEVEKMARHGKCAHCGRGPIGLNSRGLCWRCTADPEIRAKHPTAAELRQDMQDRTRDEGRTTEVAPEVQPTPAPVASDGDTLVLNGLTFKRRTGGRRLGHNPPLLTVREGTGCMNFYLNAAATTIFGLERYAYADLFENRERKSVAIRLLDKPRDLNSVKVRGGTSRTERVISATTIARELGIEPGKYEVSSARELPGVIVVDFKERAA